MQSSAVNWELQYWPCRVTEKIKLLKTVKRMNRVGASLWVHSEGEGSEPRASLKPWAWEGRLGRLLPLSVDLGMQVKIFLHCTPEFVQIDLSKSQFPSDYKREGSVLDLFLTQSEVLQGNSSVA